MTIETPSDRPSEAAATQRAATRAVAEPVLGRGLEELSVSGDFRPAFAVVADLARTIIAQVEPADLRRPTPCDELDVGELMAHLVAVVQRSVATGHHKHPWVVPEQIEGLEPDGFLVAWDAAVQAQKEVWSNDALLDEVFDLPYGRLVGWLSVGVDVGEVLVHSWDLATAIGVEVRWPATITADVLVGYRANLPPEVRGQMFPFGEVVPVADDAPVIDRLVAWMGRQP